MRPLGEWWRGAAAPRLRTFWSRRTTGLLRVAVALMVVAAVWRLGNELRGWLQDGGSGVAFDLALRYREVNLWFAGTPIYNAAERGDYPPASYVILWPMLGWLEFESARWLWAVSTVAALAWLVRIAVRESRSEGWLERAVVGLLPLSMYGTSAAIHVGQLAVHVLPVLLAGILLLRRDGAWRADLLACALLLAGLVKPTLAIPFFWIVCFVPGRLRPIVLVSLGYIAITLFAAMFQRGELSTVLFGWLAERPQALQGHANAHKWLRALGLTAWMLPVSLGILLALAVWVARRRRSDIWLLLGVTGVVAHFWIHHRVYDDLLLLVPMITLFRIAKRGPAHDGSDVSAGVLFALMCGTMLAPAGLFTAPAPVPLLFEGGQVVVALAVLAFLLDRARRQTDIGQGGALAASDARRLETASP